MTSSSRAGVPRKRAHKFGWSPSGNVNSNFRSNQIGASFMVAGKLISSQQMSDPAATMQFALVPVGWQRPLGYRIYTVNCH